MDLRASDLRGGHNKVFQGVISQGAADCKHSHHPTSNDIPARRLNTCLLIRVVGFVIPRKCFNIVAHAIPCTPRRHVPTEHCAAVPRVCYCEHPSSVDCDVHVSCHRGATTRPADARHGYLVVCFMVRVRQHLSNGQRLAFGSPQLVDEVVFYHLGCEFSSTCSSVSIKHPQKDFPWLERAANYVPVLHARSALQVRVLSHSYVATHQRARKSPRATSDSCARGCRNRCQASFLVRTTSTSSSTSTSTSSTSIRTTSTTTTTGVLLLQRGVRGGTRNC
mmetsp:Transcript_30982/g.77076  ORF Transcript_30982/g.77076 Transcript_30982/m.77076 type:complete len:278 (-) Transcript_30982:284-1117(-)